MIGLKSSLSLKNCPTPCFQSGQTSEGQRDKALEAGSVQVIYGVAGLGLGVNSDRFDLSDAGESRWVDHFGAALAPGDFNRDGSVDLAVGMPLHSSFAGQLAVFPGPHAHLQ